MSIDNLYSILGRVRLHEWIDWSKSYHRYNELMRLLALQTGHALMPTCGVFAALSPNNDYIGNLRDARKLLEAHERGDSIDDFTVSTYNGNKRKAWDIVTGPPAHGNVIQHIHNVIQHIRALKTRNFFINISDPDETTAVTVDGHMYWAWVGKKGNVKSRFSLSPKVYHRIADDIREIARHHGAVPSAIQAILWHQWRKMHGVMGVGQTEFISTDRHVVTGQLHIETSGVSR